jgi:hypothetical protein
MIVIYVKLTVDKTPKQKKQDKMAGQAKRDKTATSNADCKNKSRQRNKMRGDNSKRQNGDNERQG